MGCTGGEKRYKGCRGREKKRFIISSSGRMGGIVNGRQNDKMGQDEWGERRIAIRARETISFPAPWERKGTPQTI